MESATIDLPEVIIEAEAATQNVLCCRDILLRAPYSRDATATFILTLTLRPNLALHWSPSSGHDPAGRDANASP
jgi:hypothetical protein